MLYDTYIKNSRLPIRYLRDIPLTPSLADEQVFIDLSEIKSNIKSFVDDGKNLLICSNNCGNGKTTMATKILKEYIKEVQGYSFKNNTPALFINVNNFLSDKKNSINDHDKSEQIRKIENCILTAKLVVFDDIADKALTEYDLNSLYYWLDYRTSNLKSCIFTTNMLPDQLKANLSGKVYSRVVNYSIIKCLTDGDHREN